MSRTPAHCYPTMLPFLKYIFSNVNTRGINKHTRHNKVYTITLLPLPQTQTHELKGKGKGVSYLYHFKNCLHCMFSFSPHIFYYVVYHFILLTGCDWSTFFLMEFSLLECLARWPDTCLYYCHHHHHHHHSACTISA